MSTKYKNSKDVPTETLTARLKELADAICGGKKSFDNEFTMRVPAECDRDADLVLAESARRMADMTERERRCPTMDEAEKVALLRAIQEIIHLVGLNNENSPKDAVDAMRELTT